MGRADRGDVGGRAGGADGGGGREAAGSGTSVLFTEHDMDTVFAHAGRVLVLNRGRLIAGGTPAEVRADPLVREVYLGGGSMDAGGRMLELESVDAAYGAPASCMGVAACESRRGGGVAGDGTAPASQPR